MAEKPVTRNVNHIRTQMRFSFTISLHVPFFAPSTQNVWLYWGFLDTTKLHKGVLLKMAEKPVAPNANHIWRQMGFFLSLSFLFPFPPTFPPLLPLSFSLSLSLSPFPSLPFPLPFSVPSPFPRPFSAPLFPFPVPFPTTLQGPERVAGHVMYNVKYHMLDHALAGALFYQNALKY